MSGAPDTADAAAPFRQTADTDLPSAIRAYAARRPGGGSRLPPALQRLEAEAIEIMREVVAACQRPVFLYSIGKDSTAMLHVARKPSGLRPPPSRSCILRPVGISAR